MNKIPNKKNETKKDKTQEDKSAIKEQAINIKETDGQHVNHQVKDKREKHEPRDNA